MTPEQYLSEHSLKKEFVVNTLGWKLEPNRIVIPIRDCDGKTLFNKYRWFNNGINQAKFTYDRGNHPTLYGLDYIAKNDSLILCEGEPDCARLWQEGIPAITSTGGVRKFDNKMAELLVGKKISLFLDNDEAGQSQVSKIGKILQDKDIEVRVGDLPNEYKDVCEYFSSNSGHKFTDFIKKSIPLSDWTANNEPSEHKLLTAKDFIIKDFPPQEWLVDRIIPLEGFVFLFGAPGTGKSFISYSIAKSISMGTSWLGKFDVTKPCKVLFLDKENSQGLIQRRLKGMVFDNENAFWLEYPDKFQLVDELGKVSDFANFLSREVEQKNITLVILDSLVDFVVGDESNSGDTQAFFDVFRSLFPGIAVLIIHHENKPTQGLSRSSADRLRGSSNLSAQAHAAFRLIQRPNREIIFEQTKCREGERLGSIVLKMITDRDSDGKSLVRDFEFVGEAIEELDNKIDEAITMIRETLDDAVVIPRKDLLKVNMVKGFSKATIERAIKILMDNKELESIKNPENKREVFYSFASKQPQS